MKDMTRAILVLILLVGGLDLSAAELRIYIVTDLEGAAGVDSFQQTREDGPPREQAKKVAHGRSERDG